MLSRGPSSPVGYQNSRCGLTPQKTAGLCYAAPADASDRQWSLLMPFLVLHIVFSFVLDFLHLVTKSDHDRALELMLLRQQLRLYERKASQPRPSRCEKVALEPVMHSRVPQAPPL